MPRYLLAAIWAVLAVGKLIDSKTLTSYLEASLGSGGKTAAATTAALIGAEVAACALLLWGGRRPALLRWGCGISLALACGFLLASLSASTDHCGCFGAIAEATQVRRIAVAAVLICLAATTLRASLAPRQGLRERGWDALMACACIAAAIGFWGSGANRDGVALPPIEDLPEAEIAAAEPTPRALPVLKSRPARTQERVEEKAPSETSLHVLGHVTDADTAADVGRARVIAADPDEDMIVIEREVYTDERGQFELSDLEPQPQRVIVMKDGYQTAHVSATPVDPSEDGPPISIPLQRGLGMRVRTISTSGQPVQGADVWCIWTRAPYAWPRVPHLLSTADTAMGAHARTDAEGNCVLWGLKDRTYEVHCSHPAYTVVSPKPVLLKPSPDDVLDIEMTRSVTLEIHLLDARTLMPVGLAGGMIDVPAVVGIRRDLLIPAPLWGQQRAAGVDGEATSTAHRVRMGFALEEGADPSKLSVTLHFEIPGYEPIRQQIALEIGRANTHELALEPLASGQRGKVLFELSTPAGRAFSGTLTVNTKHVGDRVPMRRPVKFDKGIAKRPISLPAGLCAVWLTSGDGATTFWVPMKTGLKLNVKASPGTQRVRLPVAGGRVRLRVQTQGGQRVRGYSLAVEGSGSRPGYTPGRDLPGREPGDLIWLSPGSVVLRAHDPMRGLATLEVEVSSEGQLGEYTVTLDPKKAFDPAEVRARLGGMFGGK